ncbi:hypothetical protein [endosymbiont of Lamellibrachia barhami]|uniref:hypothetical protein n=1 Tax=endosymbiont of Lamellibrachia barhami TaxID=205975 RepID=UPI0015AD13D5|nr:hypothetical protein [endosymbiont of Lamellibrachia barhami]
MIIPYIGAAVVTFQCFRRLVSVGLVSRFCLARSLLLRDSGWMGMYLVPLLFSELLICSGNHLFAILVFGGFWGFGRLFAIPLATRAGGFGQLAWPS